MNSVDTISIRSVEEQDHENPLNIIRYAIIYSFEQMEYLNPVNTKPIEEGLNAGNLQYVDLESYTVLHKVLTESKLYSHEELEAAFKNGNYDPDNNYLHGLITEIYFHYKTTELKCGKMTTLALDFLLANYHEEFELFKYSSEGKFKYFPSDHVIGIAHHKATHTYYGFSPANILNPLKFLSQILYGKGSYSNLYMYESLPSNTDGTKFSRPTDILTSDKPEAILQRFNSIESKDIDEALIWKKEEIKIISHLDLLKGFIGKFIDF